MITTSKNSKDYLRKKRGFTLAEVLMAATLSAVAVGGTLSTSLMLARSGYRISQYNDLETEARRALEQFGQDVRMSSSATWVDANNITLAVVINSAGTTTNHAYSYDAAAKTLTRTVGGVSTVLLTGIESCTLMGYKLNSEPTHLPSDTPIWADLGNSTKQLQLSVSARRTQGSQVSSTQKVISARFILRNKYSS